ncbi:MAG: hypothetical protein WA364_28500 [Candidatus Nitrosopolaris sp.]
MNSIYGACNSVPISNLLLLMNEAPASGIARSFLQNILADLLVPSFSLSNLLIPICPVYFSATISDIKKNCSEERKHLGNQKVAETSEYRPSLMPAYLHARHPNHPSQGRKLC